MTKTVRINSPRAWIIAARPTTLSAAALPVLLGLSLALRDGDNVLNYLSATLCIFFAFSMQILANFINDYFDFKKGADNMDRLGPERACAQGWITLKAMKYGIISCAIIASIIGIPLIYYGGWLMFFVGALCMLFAFLYTTTLSYRAMGDVLVVLCFGLIPTAFTYYLQRYTFTTSLWVIALACGLVVNTLLVVNNYRDRDTDKNVGKKTLVVLLGEKGGAHLYFWCGMLGALLTMCYALWNRQFTCIALLPLLYLYFHSITFQKMRKVKTGRKLNSILEKTARNIILFGLLTAITILTL